MESPTVLPAFDTWIDQATVQVVSGEELGTLGQPIDTNYVENDSIFIMEQAEGSCYKTSDATVDIVSSPMASTPNREQVLSSQLPWNLLQAALFRAVATGKLASLKLMITAAQELDLLGKTGVAEGISKVINYDQRTLLHLASAEGHGDIVSFLLENQADPYAKDRWGATPIDDAWENGHMEVVEIFEYFLARKRKEDHVVNMDWRPKSIQRGLDIGPDTPWNGGHRLLPSFASNSLTKSFPLRGLRRAVSSPVEVDTENEQRQRSVSVQEDESFTFLVDRLFSIDSPSSERENQSESGSSVSGRVESERENIFEEDSEQEEDNQLMKVAEEELDKAYRSEKDKIFQKYRKLMEQKLGSLPHRLGLLSLI